MCYIYLKKENGLRVFLCFQCSVSRFQISIWKFQIHLHSFPVNENCCLFKIKLFDDMNLTWNTIPAYLTLSEGEKIILSFARNWMSMNIIWQSIVFALEIQFCRNHWRGNTLSCYILHVISMFVREKRQDCHVKRVNPFDLLLLSFIFYLADFL